MDEKVATTAAAMGAVSVSAADAIIVLNRDLMFGVRIGNGLRAIGYQVAFVATTEQFATRLREDRPTPVLGILDMNGVVDWTAISGLVADPQVATPILAFGPHVDVENRRAAKQAGVTRIVSNGDFHQGMIALVQRYAATPAVGGVND